MGSDSFIKLVLTNFDVLAGPLVTNVYPLYATFKSINDDTASEFIQQWFTYWLLGYFIKSFELAFVAAIEWFPLWSYAKLIFTCWLVLPYFNGAAYIFRKFATPLIFNKEMSIPIFWSVLLNRIIWKLVYLFSDTLKYVRQTLFNEVPDHYQNRRRRRLSILEEVEAQRRAEAKKEFRSRSKITNGVYGHKD